MFRMLLNARPEKNKARSPGVTPNLVAFPGVLLGIMDPSFWETWSMKTYEDVWASISLRQGYVRSTMHN
jgi:hypothetical protein